MEILACVLCALAVLVFGGAQAQELEPRAFSPAPVGMNFAALGYLHSEGGVFVDRSLPAEDASGEIHTAVAAFVRTIDVFGASGKISALVPFAWGDWQGIWLGEPATTSRRGIGDPAVSCAVNFYGAPTHTLQEMRNYRETTVVGAALLATVPIGQYDPDKLINLGSNRWSLRPRLGASRRAGRWSFEAIAEAWLFTKNPDAFGDNSIRQDPILAIQLNAIHQFRRGLWLGLGFGYGEGGQTTVSGEEKDTHQINRRLGATFVYPISRRNSLKLVYLRSLSTRIGSDFDRVGVFWQLRWGGV